MTRGFVAATTQVLKDYLTTAQVAQKLGCTVEAARKHAQRHDLGFMLGPRMRLWGPGDVAELRLRLRKKP